MKDRIRRLIEAMARVAAGSGDGRRDANLVQGTAFEFDEPANEDELAVAPWGANAIREIWRHWRTVSLYKDPVYGQWGLRVLSPSEAVQRTEAASSTRPTDFFPGDFVVAEFFGDSDLLVLNAEGEVLLASPLDERRDWQLVAPSLEQFLIAYGEALGDKYWERAARGR
jgi:hypothetical protein